MWNESIVYDSQLRAKADVRLFEMRDLGAIQKLEDDAFGCEAWPQEDFREYARLPLELAVTALPQRSEDYNPQNAAIRCKDDMADGSTDKSSRGEVVPKTWVCAHFYRERILR